MEIELNFYKQSGKWYTKEIINISDIDLVIYYVMENNLYPDMDYTIHIIEEDGFLQPYRIFKRY